MWNELTKHLGDFPNAILTGGDAQGYPFSVVCQPKPEAGAQALRVQVPDYADIQVGPAGLLCHKHNEQLWELKSFLVRGSLERDAQGWLFQPIQFIPGAGIGGTVAVLKFLLNGRRAAKQYLQKRGLAQPEIRWDKIHAMWAETHNAKSVKSKLRN